MGLIARALPRARRWPILPRLPQQEAEFLLYNLMSSLNKIL